VERVLRLESLDLPVEGPTAPVAVFTARFEAALRNLVQNARHHAGGATAIRTELAGEGTVARVVVEDEGPGVPAEETERIFERFARGAVSGRRSSHSGVGLGLALVREHIRLQDGSAWVEPRPGGGSRFVLELPIATR
jgi:signal transduction histidine kinase